LAGRKRLKFNALVVLITAGLALLLWFSAEIPLGATVVMAAALIAAIVLLSGYASTHPDVGRVRLFSAVNLVLLGLVLLTLAAGFLLPLSDWVHFADELHRLHLLPDP
jgi:amino acid permease